MAMQRIGVLGTGDVGRVLASGFIGLGHEVMMGSRTAHNPKAAEWVQQAGDRASSGTFADAARFGEVLVIATLWEGTAQALQSAGTEPFAGKVVLDVTNPLDFSSGQPRLAVGHTDSGAEQIQRLLPGARVVKCFNTVGNPHMVKPSFKGGTPDMFICGDDPEAKKTASRICQAFGWPTVDIGGLETARYLEPMAMVWVSYLMRTGTGDHAFALLRN